MVLIQVLSSFRVFGNLAGYFSYRDISPTFNRHLYGLSTIVSYTLPGIIIPAWMGAFGTTKHGQWQFQFILNSVIVILGNIIYIGLVTTDPASWEPTLTNGEQAEAEENVLAHFGKQDATEQLIEKTEFKEKPSNM